MKTVHNADMVAHLWAHQSQHTARTPTGNLFFNDNIIFSYGHHFPIARIVQRKGKEIVLFTSKGYSNTTANHKSIVRRAARGDVVTVADVLGKEHKSNLAAFKAEIETDCKAMFRSRTQTEWKLDVSKRTVANANAYCEFFGLKTRFEMPDESSIRKTIAKQREQAKAAAAKAEAKRSTAIAEAMKIVEEWKAGADVQFPWIVTDVYLRIKGDELHTSKGARVPLAHALKILPLVRSGRPYQHNGHSVHVGEFRIDSIDEQGNIRAGCHLIKREEIERIAATIEPRT